MTTIKIDGMSCAHCTGLVKTTLEAMGMTNVSVSLEKAQASFVNAAGVALDQVAESINELGFEATTEA